ncbi:unnamed protein product [Arctia plantaginis]|uniref:Uncharacterized protein n=1 Tax=Arctia plantaginis TaxID=874455 RepID=A0A8S1A1F0_ARCPL|nr:unnamed protein product [Arctia plantaginis]
MAAATAPRKTVSIYDYPEHLNPFHEEDNHNKIRFWSLGRRLNRSNSISFSGLKDLKNSWAFRSFMKKGKKGQQAPTEKSSSQTNGQTSPIVFRRGHQYSIATRSTVGSPERTDRYVYGGSVTPLPRSRFQERLRSTSNHEVNSLSATPRMARSEVCGSRLSVESTNPFDEDGPVPPVRASRRKKKRAPLPPPGTVAVTPDTTLDTTADSIADTTVDSIADTTADSIADTTADSVADTTTSSTANTTVTSTAPELQIIEIQENKLNSPNAELELEDVNLNIELKIVEDEDNKNKVNAIAEAPSTKTEHNNEIVESLIVVESIQTSNIEQTETKRQPNGDMPTANDEPIRNTSSEEDILNSATFRKVDIVKYRRNSSVNEDDIRLRRGNLEDFQSLSNKRSKSLGNTFDSTFTTYDINLNDTIHMDTNGNEEPHKVVCKLYEDTPRKQSIETISSTEKEFLEIDRATRELEREINKLNSALHEDLPETGDRLSVSEIKRRFDKKDVSSPNPIPKPRRSHYGGSSTP